MYKVPEGSFLKHNTILTNKILRKKNEVVNKKIPNTSGLVKKADLNTKITEIEKWLLLLLMLKL